MTCILSMLLSNVVIVCRRLFSMFDDLATLHGVQKVETAGAVPKADYFVQYSNLFDGRLISKRCVMPAGDCYIVAGGILGLDAEGFAEVGLE